MSTSSPQATADPAECFAAQLVGESINADVGGLLVGISSESELLFSSRTIQLMSVFAKDIIINALLRE